jgi:erythronate-4-phosphate dehydrogenase
MHALADRNIARLDQTFGQELTLTRFEGRSLDRNQLGDAEVLLVRSVTPVDENLLSGSRVRFVGSATIGTDHLDTDWLERNGIVWAAAPGCNADAAAQYTLAMMMLACRRLGRRLAAQRVGIIGHGNVGSRLRRLLDVLGVETRVNDPPLLAAGGLDPGVRAASLEEALAGDIVSLHVPLTRGGRWPTAGMIDARAFSKIHPGALLVNASRGGVVDGTALGQALAQQRVFAALDVWPGEPNVDADLLAAITVASPHVAGYSVEGKERGTRMIFDAFRRWRTRAGHTVPDPGGVNGTVSTDRSGSESAPERSAERSGSVALSMTVESGDIVTDAVLRATGVEADDERMRAEGTLTAANFDVLRRAHSPRHEFAHIAIDAPTDRAILQALGFRPCKARTP